MSETAKYQAKRNQWRDLYAKIPVERRARIEEAVQRELLVINQEAQADKDWTFCEKGCGRKLICVHDIWGDGPNPLEAPPVASGGRLQDLVGLVNLPEGQDSVSYVRMMREIAESGTGTGAREWMHDTLGPTSEMRLRGRDGRAWLLSELLEAYASTRPASPEWVMVKGRYDLPPGQTRVLMFVRGVGKRLGMCTSVLENPWRIVDGVAHDNYSCKLEEVTAYINLDALPSPPQQETRE